MAYYEPYNWMVIEHTPQNEWTALHVLSTPALSAKKGYVWLTSIESFRSRQMKKKFGPDARPPFANIRWFSVYNFDEWTKDRARTKQRMEEILNRPYTDQYESLPVIQHDSLFSFYDAIGWDRKKGRLLDWVKS